MMHEASKDMWLHGSDLIEKGLRLNADDTSWEGVKGMWEVFFPFA